MSSSAVHTLPPHSITRSSAASGGEILPDVAGPVLQRGVVFSTAANPVLPSSVPSEEDDGDSVVLPVFQDSTQFQSIPVQPAQLEQVVHSAYPVREGKDTVQGKARVLFSTTASAVMDHAEQSFLGQTLLKQQAIERGASANGAGYGSFSASLDNLRPGTLYHVRAYAIAADGAVYYGPPYEFTTADACFIATAAYGTINHPAVTILRQFRDTMLSSNAFGQIMIDTYYHLSPSLARGISEHAALRWLARLVLLPLVGLCWLALSLGPLSVFTVVMLVPVLVYCLRHRVRRPPVWRRFPNTQQGFTLIELMVVMVILGVLAALITPRIMDRPEEARRTKAEVQIRAIEQALKLYRLDNGQYPTTEQGLQALVTPPALGKPARKWRQGGYLERGRVPKDPWGADYVYLSPGMHDEFDLISYGADHQAGGEGKDADVNNWELQ